jgi:hypothetical protein
MREEVGVDAAVVSTSAATTTTAATTAVGNGTSVLGLNRGGPHTVISDGLCYVQVLKIHYITFTGGGDGVEQVGLDPGAQAVVYCVKVELEVVQVHRHLGQEVLGVGQEVLGTVQVVQLTKYLVHHHPHPRSPGVKNDAQLKERKKTFVRHQNSQWILKMYLVN